MTRHDATIHDKYANVNFQFRAAELFMRFRTAISLPSIFRRSEGTMAAARKDGKMQTSSVNEFTIIQIAKNGLYVLYYTLNECMSANVDVFVIIHSTFPNKMADYMLIGHYNRSDQTANKWTLIRRGRRTSKPKEKSIFY